jgi:hypothetical protein
MSRETEIAAQTTCAPERCAPASVSDLALAPRKLGLSTPFSTSASTATGLIALDPEAFIQKALRLLSSERLPRKGMGLMALTGRRPAEIFVQPAKKEALLARPYL